MERLRKENTSSPEKARRFLYEEGFLDANGEVAQPYASAQPHNVLLDGNFFRGHESPPALACRHRDSEKPRQFQ